MECEKWSTKYVDQELKRIRDVEFLVRDLREELKLRIKLFYYEDKADGPPETIDDSKFWQQISVHGMHSSKRTPVRPGLRGAIRRPYKACQRARGDVDGIRQAGSHGRVRVALLPGDHALGIAEQRGRGPRADGLRAVARGDVLGHGGNVFQPAQSGDPGTDGVLYRHVAGKDRQAA